MPHNRARGAAVGRDDLAQAERVERGVAGQGAHRFAGQRLRFFNGGGGGVGKRAAGSQRQNGPAGQFQESAAGKFLGIHAKLSSKIKTGNGYAVFDLIFAAPFGYYFKIIG